MLPLRFDILDTKRKSVFDKLGILQNAVLAGGTGLALQIAHRYSYDFDIFLPRDIKRKEYNTIQKEIGIQQVMLDTSDQLSIVTKDNINITLLNYPFPFIGKKIKTNTITVSSLTDIALDKAYTIGRRAIFRDYVDLYFLLSKKYITLQEIIRKAPKKFREEFNPKLFLEQLVYMQDIEETPLSYVQERAGKEKIHEYFITQVKRIIPLTSSRKQVY